MGPGWGPPGRGDSASRRLAWLGFPQMGDAGVDSGPGADDFPGQTWRQGRVSLEPGPELRLGLGPRLAGGLGVRAKEPAARASAGEAGAAGAGGQGAAR